jgi:hypothetical protein
VFYGLLFPDVIFESLLFPADGEAYVFVEFHVVTGSDVDIIFILVVCVSFHCLIVVEWFSLLSFRPWSRRFNTEAFQKVFDVFEKFTVSITDTDVSFSADRSFRVGESSQKSRHASLAMLNILLQFVKVYRFLKEFVEHLRLNLYGV